MRLVRWLSPCMGIALLTAMSSTESCGNDPSPGIQGKLVIAGGDGQTGLAATALPARLEVEVIGADGQRVNGYRVRWITTPGGGSVSSQYSEAALDQTGAYVPPTATWTLGPGTGVQTLRATVVDLDPADTVTFTATASICQSAICEAIPTMVRVGSAGAAR